MKFANLRSIGFPVALFYIAVAVMAAHTNASAASLPSVQEIYDSSRKNTVKIQPAAVSIKLSGAAMIAVEAAKKSKPLSPDSLRDESTAKKLDISKLSIFGPLSGSYRYDSRMVRAAEIAAARAYGRSQGSCWRYVKNALLSAGLVDSRPTSAYAKEAAAELTSKYGFRRISCSDPYKAPLGSVLVYGGSGAGHVEFRTRTGFVSDFTTPRPSKRPLIGVYVK